MIKFVGAYKEKIGLKSKINQYKTSQPKIIYVGAGDKKVKAKE